MTEQRVWEQTVIVFGSWTATQAMSEWAVGKVHTTLKTAHSLAAFLMATNQIVMTWYMENDG